MVDLGGVQTGTVVGGSYTTDHFIRQDEGGAFFGATSQSGEPVLIKLAAAPGAAAEEQLALWQRCLKLRHPNLLAVRETGQCEVDGRNCIYGVFEMPDDVLASALDVGPLSEDETRGVVDAALDALRYIHAQGLVHGVVDAENVFAVGDTVKLGTDRLRPAREASESERDFRLLGYLAKRLREPEVVDPALTRRIEGAQAAAAPKEPAKVIELPPARPVRRDVEDEAPSRPFPKWIFAGVGALLLAIVFFNVRGPKVQTPPPQPAASVPQPAAPMPVASAPTPVRQAPVVEASGKWHVIAFTYRNREAAEKKVQAINRKRPELHASIFTPHERRGYYLVALGGAMPHEAATRLQRRARKLGLARDVYVQNYSQQ